jgi:DNA polymerase-3 subunit gamma/tau
VKELAGHIASGDLAAGIGIIHRVSNDGLDLKQFNREIVAYLRELLLIKTGAAETLELADTELAELKDLAGKTSLNQILNAVKLFGKLESGFDQYSTLPLELALVDCALASGESKTPAKSQPTATAANPPTPEKARSLTANKMPEKTNPEAAPPAAKAEPPVVEENPAMTAKPRLPATPEAEPPFTEPEATIESEPGDDLERLRAGWKQIIEEAPPEMRKTTAMAFLRSGGVKVAAITDNSVVLAFRYAMHKDQIEKPENQRIVETLISQYLNRPCQVRCTCEPEKDHLVRAVQNIGAQITSVEEK